jgi:hypothetical protein
VTLRLPALSLAALGGVVLASAAPAADTPRPLRELRCDLMETGRGGRMTTIEAPGLNVLQQTAAAGWFNPDIPAGTSAIMCGRSSILPAAHDDEVIALGLPLFIAETGSGRRLGVLEIEQGRFRFRMIEGSLNADEQAAMDSRLDEFQRRVGMTTPRS